MTLFFALLYLLGEGLGTPGCRIYFCLDNFERSASIEEVNTENWYAQMTAIVVRENRLIYINGVVDEFNNEFKWSYTDDHYFLFGQLKNTQAHFTELLRYPDCDSQSESFDHSLKVAFIPFGVRLGEGSFEKRFWEWSQDEALAKEVLSEVDWLYSCGLLE